MEESTHVKRESNSVDNPSILLRDNTSTSEAIRDAGEGTDMCKKPGANTPEIEEVSNITDTKEDNHTTANASRKIGYAPIKQEFLILDYKPTLHTEYLSSEVKDKLELMPKDSHSQLNDLQDDSTDGDNEEHEPPQKKAKLKGRNKHRPKNERIQDKDKICPAIKENKECKFGDKCKFSHDKKDFISKKLPELEGPCYVFDTFGYCNFGIACRYAKNHLTEDLQNIQNEDLYSRMKNFRPQNELSFDMRNKLWKRKYNFKRADQVVKHVQKSYKGCNDNVDNNIVNNSIAINGKNETENILPANVPQLDNTDSCDIKVVMVDDPKLGAQRDLTESFAQSDVGEVDKDVKSQMLAGESLDESKTLGCITDEEIIRVRPQEVKKIDFKNKLYLAPLTTVGNLPFRRICKNFGADVTCGEMALVTQLLKGKQSEWSLIKRHPSEDLFGVQICGSYPDTMTRCAQLLTETCNVDFIDINCGCPIDLIYRKGGGSALLGKVTKLEQICRTITSVIGDTPLTVKLRMGVFDNKNVAHTILPRLRDAGVSLVTVHGRSREQRYTKQADWDYIAKCAQAASPMPIFGNGDILSYEEANLHMEKHGVSGVMIARGALIKPWLFTEIKEQRHWDISASERFDILRTYTNYGLEHWGSDHQGVENTRRFLLEWLSFLHRYIPVGVLEQIPQRINERPPYYVGRNDLETLMASASCADWIKISEMLLGPVPASFQFLPKHKANAYQ